jgi:tRNA dimethylallyltransferase
MKTARPVLEGCFLVGPTAVGKTSVAQWIAENHDYDILSADSMVVYRGMDIGTAKPGDAERSCVRYHGLDLLTPDKPFSVWDYRQHALKALAACAAAGRRILVVGGSGLYIKSLTDGLSPTSVSNPERRKLWTEMAETKGVEALQKALQERNIALYESLSDKQNPRRLIRALEQASASVPASPAWKKEKGPKTLVGLTMPSSELKQRVESRVAAMYRSGLVDEVRRLLAEYPDLSMTARQAIGYSEAMDLVAGRYSEREAMARTVTRTLQLAKRQRTWFRHQAKVEWIEVGATMEVRRIAEKALEMWRRYGSTRIAD